MAYYTVIHSTGFLPARDIQGYAGINFFGKVAWSFHMQFTLIQVSGTSSW
jgi:hypothetical protein